MPMPLSDLGFDTAPQPPWPRPAACSLEEGTLRFAWAISKAEGKDGKMTLVSNSAKMPDSRVWQRFIALADRGDEQIRRFAERYGQISNRGPVLLEDTAIWRRYASIGKAIANAGAAVSRGVVGESHDWLTLSDWCFGGEGIAPVPANTDVTDWKVLVAHALHKWVNIPSQCETGVRWCGELLDVCVRPTGLLGLIGCQIANALGQGGRLEKCAGCGVMFNPARRATTGTRRYCVDCREEGVDHKISMRESRARRKARCCPAK